MSLEANPMNADDIRRGIAILQAAGATIEEPEKPEPDAWSVDEIKAAQAGSQDRAQAILAKVYESQRETIEALDAAVAMFVSNGVGLSQLEVISEPHKGPGAWRVRVRRKICECGRSV